MLSKLKTLFNSFGSKTEAISQTNVEIKSVEVQQRDCQRLVDSRVQEDRSTINSYDINSVRRRITGEIDEEEIQAARQRSRDCRNRWFAKSELSDSGSFNALEVQRRIEESQYRDEETLDLLPPVEDTFMAFSRPELDLFADDQSITLSGIFRAISPNEDFEEEYSMPLIPLTTFVEELKADESMMIDEEEPVYAQEYSVYYLPAEAVEEEYTVKTVDPSRLFEEPVAEFQSYVHASTGDGDFEGNSSDSDQIHAVRTLTAVVRNQDNYWTESDRLTRFGRRRTSASCSSTRLRALSIA